MPRKFIDIAFDLDGCFIDLNDTVEKIVRRMWNKDVSQPPEFNICNGSGLLPEQAEIAFELAYRANGRTPIFPGARELCCELWEKTGDMITFVTGRSHFFASETFETVQRFCPVPFTIAFTGDAGDKLQYVKNFNYFVEDRRKTVKILAAAGVKVFKPRRSYNEMDPMENVIEIEGIHELLGNTNVFVRES